MEVTPTRQYSTTPSPPNPLTPTLRYIILLLVITMINACGSSPSSDNESFELGVPSPPTGVTATVGPGAGQVTLRWNSVYSAISYNMYWSTTPGVSKNNGSPIKKASNPYIHSDLLIDVVYYYVVTAVNGNGESAVSEEVSATLLTTPPSSISAVAGNTQVTVSWSSVPGASFYNLYSATSSPVSKSTYSTRISTITSSHTVTGLTNLNKYYFMVTAENINGESSESGEVSATPYIPGAPVTISGRVMYEDKEYGVSGFTGSTSYKPVRYATVEIVNKTTSSVVSSGTTTMDGTFSIINLLSSDSPMYARVISSASTTSWQGVNVKNLSGALFSVPGSDFAPIGDTTTNISVPTTNLAAGAFNILDVFTSGAEFIYSLDGTQPPLLNAFWQANNVRGTYYCTPPVDAYWCPGGEGIYVLSYNSDTDEYDDDVLWHEYGHFTAAKFSKDDSPGGPHRLSDNDLDMRLSWSEGWGDFFPGAVKTWLRAVAQSRLSTTGMPDSQYIDTIGSGIQISIDIASAPYIYATSEIAVAKVLWGLMAGDTNLGTIAFGMQPVWDVINGYIPGVTTPVNLEAFWDGWRLRPTFASEKATLETVYGGRQIFYKEDSFEADDSFPVARSAFTVNGAGETHYLYKNDGSADVDIVPFDVVSGHTYTIWTVNLKNGADTIIQVLDPNKQPLAGVTNDNANGLLCSNNNTPSYYIPGLCDADGVCHENYYDILSSRTTFIPTSPGTYYVEVTSSLNRPVSAGRYGTYTLTITSL